MLSKENILKNMCTVTFGREIIYLDEIDSTNNYAKNICENVINGTLVVADCQTSGKGRLGRSWNSPHGKAIFMSLLIKEDIDVSKASMITLVAAMAVLEAVKKSGLDAKIKWPNDIVVNGKKVCGILTEMKTDSSNAKYVIVGIGINVNNDSFSEEIISTATSMKLEAGEDFDRNVIVCDVMKGFEKYFELFTRSGDLLLIMSEYNDNLVNVDKEVMIISGEDSYKAISKGIDRNGGLIVNDSYGKSEVIVSGEVSVRGVYGYV